MASNADLRGGGSDRRARGGQLGGPAGADEVLPLDGAGEPADQGGAGLLVRAGEQDLTGVGVRRARLGVQVVAVVPQRHQPEVVHRGERRRTRPDHRPDRPAGDRQEGAVAGGRAGVRGQHHVPTGAEPCRHGRVEACHVAVVGHAEQHAPARGEGGGGGVGEQRRPVGSRKRGPDRPRRLPGGESADGGAVVVGRPGGGRGVEVGLRWRRRRARLLLDGGVPGRHRQPQHVGAGAGVARGDELGEPGDRAQQHRLGAHRPPQRRQPAGVVGLGDPLDDEPVDVLPGEPHLHPRPGHHLGVEPAGHEVVERLVEVRQRHVDEHPCDGQVRGGLDRGGLLGLGRRLGAGLAGGGAGAREPGQLQLLVRRHARSLPTRTDTELLTT